MAWSGGTFTGLHNWETDAAAGVKILSSRHKAQDDVFIAGINSCINKDGSNAMTGNFNAGSNKLSSVAAATVASDAPRTDQIQDGSLTYAVDTGSANTYAISLTPNETAHVGGQVFWFKAVNANTGASTLSVDSIATIDIKKYHNVALVAGDIVANQLVGVVYDATTSDFVMISQTTTAPILTSVAAQTNITSLGTLTALQVDNLNINGNTISSTSGTDLNITPLSGQQIVLDGTIVIDSGIITGASSISSTSFVGALTGNASGTAATVTGAAQSAITSLGTLSSLAVTGEVTGAGFTGTLDGILGGGTPAAASVTTLAISGAISGASFKDEDNMGAGSPSATAVASQQSIKAYVDASGGGGLGTGESPASMQAFTSSGTWTRPTDIKKVMVYCVGGGGGAGSPPAETGGAGGGGGGCAIELIDVSGTGSETVTIGAGGAGGTGGTANGASGGVSSFGSFCSASGGATSQSNGRGNGGAGGIGTGGLINFRGNGGGGGAYEKEGSAGGGSFFAGGAAGTQGTSEPGINAYEYGGGGSGGTDADNGGNGRAGIIMVMEYK
jgi:hypothetical protein